VRELVVLIAIQCGGGATSQSGRSAARPRIGKDAFVIHILGNIDKTLCGLRLRPHSKFQFETVAEVDAMVTAALRGEKIDGSRKPSCRACIRLYEQMRRLPENMPALEPTRG
jgi:hypothetical protein